MKILTRPDTRLIATGADSHHRWSEQARTPSDGGKILQHVAKNASSTNIATYKYDKASRLISAVIPFHTLTYGFSASGGCGVNTKAGASGNRTRLTDTVEVASGSRITTTTDYCYDWADRLTSSNVRNVQPGATPLTDGVAGSEISYDSRGNMKTVADMSFEYDAYNRLIRTRWANGDSVTIVRDMTGRPELNEVRIGSQTSIEKLSYMDESTNPMMTSSTAGDRTHHSLPGGATLQDWSNKRDWSYANLLGHTLVAGDGASVGALHIYDPDGRRVFTRQAELFMRLAEHQGYDTLSAVQHAIAFSTRSALYSSDVWLERFQLLDSHPSLRSEAHEHWERWRTILAEHVAVAMGGGRADAVPMAVAGACHGVFLAQLRNESNAANDRESVLIRLGEDLARVCEALRPLLQTR